MVLALDADHLAVERLYRSLRADGTPNILPLVMNLADASPALGWRGQERKRLEDRGKPDLVLCLALVHHACITANIPLESMLDWLASLGATLVIEFVTREDPMAAALLRARSDHCPAYNTAAFETALHKRFVVDAWEPLASGTRILYRATPRNT